MIKKTIIMMCLAFATQAQKLPQLGKNSNKEVIAAMTLEEKAKILVGEGLELGAPPALQTTDQSANKPTTEAIKKEDKKVPGAAGNSFAIPRLGIPSIYFSDGPSGVKLDPIRKGTDKTFYANDFPIGTLLASSWDVDLVKKVGAAIGNESHEYGIDVILGPGLNIHRNPLGGRNFEYFSEDPLITGKMAAAYIQGLQSQGVGNTPKHFAANNQETNRNSVDVIVSPRAMREIYLRGFEIAVKEANPWWVMTSYNMINGIYAPQNHDLVTKVLRQDWGYKGAVMTDWFGGNDAAEIMKSGNDLLMPGTPEQTKAIIDSVKNKKLDEKVLDENVSRVLDIIQRSLTFKNYTHSNNPDLEAHAQISRTAAEESMVLLKNQHQTLPLKNAKNISLYGIASYETIKGGTGFTDVKRKYIINIADGLEKAGFEINKNLKAIYPVYIKEAKAKRPPQTGFMDVPDPIDEMTLSKKEIEDYANKEDLAIITIGRSAGEGKDRKVENDYDLTKIEQDLIQNVSEAYHAKNKKVVLVLNIGGVVETASWRDKVDAILLAWQPGLEAGNAVVDLLIGKANPSGKLATTFAKKYADEPTAKNFPGKEFPEKATIGFEGTKIIPAIVDYKEGIYVGYRGFDKENISPAYEFGYGLSYTNFVFSDLKLSAKNFKDKITVNVTIKNIGKIAGKEVAQLYLSAPAKIMDKPMQELKAFAKTKLLKPNESQTLTFDLDSRSLASFDETTSSWVAEKGNYTVKMGASSRDIKLKANFKLAQDKVIEKVNKALIRQ